MNFLCKLLHKWQEINLLGVRNNRARKCLRCNIVEVYVYGIGWLSEKESELYEPE